MGNHETPIPCRQFSEKVTYWGIVVNEFNLLHTGSGQLFHEFFLFGSQFLCNVH